MNNQLTKSTPTDGEFRVMREQAQALVQTGFLPVSIKTPEQALAIILTGRELGIPAMAALNTINVIQGKPTVSPQLMLALIERSGQLEDIRVETNGSSVSVTMKRKGRSAHTEVFGEQSAKAMGLLSKDNYRKQPLVMYRWRAVAACARVVFPDVILGLYTPDEMGATVEVDEEGMMTVIDTGVPENPTQLEHERRQLLDALGKVLRDLNDAGYKPRWNAKTIEDFCREKFGVEDGVNGLFLDELEDFRSEMVELLGVVSQEDICPAMQAEAFAESQAIESETL